MNIYYKASLFISFLFAILFLICEYIILKKLVTAASNYSGTKNEILHQIKKRYTNCNTLGKPINNSYAHAKKILYSDTCTSTLHSCSIICFVVSALILWTGIYIYPVYVDKLCACALFSFIVYYSCMRLTAADRLLENTVILCADYLDNTLYNRYSPSGHTQRSLTVSEIPAIKPQAAPVSNAKNNDSSHKKADKTVSKSIEHNTPMQNTIPVFGANDSKLLDDILNEFLS